MIITDSINETNYTGSINNFRIKESAIAYKILYDKLYSYPFVAVVRELISNAYDAQVVNGNPKTPIDIKAPTSDDPTFVIRDYGIGLSKEEVASIYTVFFESNKRDNNDVTGCFGLGSKSPFAISDAFTVTSYYNGKEYSYLNVKQDVPTFIEVKEKETLEPNGVKISIPVNKNSYGKLLIALNYLDLLPEVNTTYRTGNNIGYYKYKNMYILSNDINYIYNNSRSHIAYLKQGCTVIPISNEEFSSIVSGHSRSVFNSFAAKRTVIFDIPIGTLKLTPSREAWYNEQTEYLEVLSECRLLLKEFMEYVITANDIPLFVNKIKHNAVKHYLSNSKNLYHTPNINTSIVEDNYDIKDSVIYQINDVYAICKANITNINTEYEYLRLYNEYDKYFIFSLTKNKRNIVIFNNKYSSIKRSEFIDNLHEHIFPNQNIIYITLFNNRYYNKEDNFRDKIKIGREFRRLFKSLAESKVSSGSVEFYGLNNLIRKYKDLYDNNPKETRVSTKENKSIVIRELQISLTDCYESKYNKTIKQIFGNYSPRNTLIIVNDNYEVDSYHNRIWSSIDLSRYLLKIEHERRYVFLDYLIDKTKKNGYLEFLSTQRSFSPRLNILGISKSNLRFFKGYTTISLEGFKDYLIDNNIKLNLITNDNSHLRYSYNNFHKYLYALNKKYKKKVIKSRWFTKIKRIYNYFEKKLTTDINEYISNNLGNTNNIFIIAILKSICKEDYNKVVNEISLTTPAVSAYSFDDIDILKVQFRDNGARRGVSSYHHNQYDFIKKILNTKER